MDDLFCATCGTLLAPACPVCGAPTTIDDEFCSYCDLDLESAAIAAESGLLATIVDEVETELSPAMVTAAANDRPEERKPEKTAQVVSNLPSAPQAPTTATFPQGRFCTSCGTEAKPQAAFCVRCGKRLT